MPARRCPTEGNWSSARGHAARRGPEPDRHRLRDGRRTRLVRFSRLSIRPSAAARDSVADGAQDHRRARRLDLRAQRSRPRNAVYDRAAACRRGWRRQWPAQALARVSLRRLPPTTLPASLGNHWSLVSNRVSSTACRVPSPANSETAATVRVLIVDNEEAHAEAVAESLERVGYHCHVATSGTARRQADRARAVRRHHHRPGDERPRRPGHPQPGQGRSARRRSDPGHRPWHHSIGRHGHAAGGVQLPAQAARLDSIRAVVRKGGGSAAAASHECRIESAAGREVRLRRGRRRQPAR